MPPVQALHTCPCCGYRGLRAAAYANFRSTSQLQGLQPPYADQLGTASYEVCDCCGFEFGNDDDPGTASGVSFGEYLAAWISSGTDWFDVEAKPSDWSLDEQLQSAGIRKPC